MKIDISCLKSSFNEPGIWVAVNSLAAMLSGAQQLTREAESIKSWVHCNVRKSHNHPQFPHFPFTPEYQFFIVGVHFILKVPNVSKILMCNIDKGENYLCDALLLKYVLSPNQV